MFDSEYFRTLLQADVEAAGGSAVVALHLINGRSYRLRSVLGVERSLVTLEVYEPGNDEVHRRARWKAEARAGEDALETHRAVVAYESITDVTITAAGGEDRRSIGFGRHGR